MNIIPILERKYPGAEWSLSGNEYSGLVWHSEGEPPTEAQLKKLWPTVQAEIAAEAQAKIDARLSAISKLEALGLTVDEVQAAFGFTADV
jgi:hypothetical protein